MAASIDSEPADTLSPATSETSVVGVDHPAAVAAGRVWAAGLALGVLGLALCALVIARLFLSWHVTPKAASHHISLLGQPLSYPVGNIDAVVILALALAGLSVAAMTITGAVREFVIARSFQRCLAALAPRPLNGALVIEDERPHAFCAGLFSPRVYISSGAVASLDETALNAVLAHEAHHARRRDPLRLALGRVLARSLFFVPGLDELVRKQQELAELSADETAISAGPDHRSALARAMLIFTDALPGGGSVGIDARRVDHLLGDPPSWRFPTLLCLLAGGVIALVAAVVVLIGQVAAGSATLAPPFLSNQPCIVVLALIPGVIGLGCVGITRAVRRRLDPEAIGHRRRP